MPDAPSLPWKAKVTGWLYQPFESAGRSAAAPVTDGAVSSYLMTTGAPSAVSPAPFVQLPGTAASALSGPEYVALVQLEIPDPGSLPLKATGTAWLNQPLWSAPRLSAPTTPTGGPSS